MKFLDCLSKGKGGVSLLQAMGNTLGSCVGVGMAKPLTGDFPSCAGWAVEVGCPLPGVISDPTGQNFPCLAPHLTWASKNLALTCVWMQQGYSWRTKKPKRCLHSVLCLATIKKKQQQTQTDTRESNFFFLMNASGLAFIWYFRHLHINCSIMALPSFSSAFVANELYKRSRG